MNRPVFDLHEIADQTVGRTTLNKVPLSCEELFAVWRSILIDEIAEESPLAVFLDLVERDGTDDGLDHSAVVGGDDDVVGLDPERHSF